MKKMFENFNKRNAYFAIGVLGFIAIVTIIMGGWMPVAGIALATALPALTDKETAFLAHLKGELNTELDKFQKGYITETNIKKFVTDKLDAAVADGIKKSDWDTLKATVEANGLKLQRLDEGEEAKEKTLVEQIKENLTGIKKAVSKEVKEYEFVIKANVTRASVASSTQSLRLLDIGQLAHRKLVARDRFQVIPVGPASNGVIRYADWDADTIVRAAAMVAEGLAFPGSTAASEEFTLSLKKIGDTIPVTEEMVQDAPRFAAELGQFLETNVALIEDTQLTTGDGTGNNLTGYYVSAETYVPAAAGITDANIYDLIVKVSEGITTTSGSKYSPDTVFMNIADINKMKLKKDNNNNYVMPPFVTQDGQVVAGMVVIETNAITANTMVVCDAQFGKIYEVEGYNISTGYTGDQFTKDLMTLKAKKREALLIRDADKAGFVKVTSISSALTTLAT